VDILPAIVQFVLAAGVIVVAGAFLARSADRIAEVTGFGRLLVGSVLLAGATSLPELSVDVSASLKGLDDIAVGDLVGSSLANLLILGVADLLHRSGRGMLSRAAAAHAISGAMSMVLTAAAGVMLLSRFGVGVWGVGFGSVAIFVAYVLGLRIVVYDQRLAARQAGAVGEEGKKKGGPGELRSAGLTFAGAAAAIFVAAPFVADAAGTIAEATGLGGTFVGTTLVAFSTSLPELVSTITAVRMRSFDLAVGNIFGSNAFNMAMLLPVDIVSKGPLLSTVSETHAVTCLWVVLITGVVLIGQLYGVERRKRGLEPDALMVIGLVILALFTVYRLR